MTVAVDLLNPLVGDPVVRALETKLGCKFSMQSVAPSFGPNSAAPPAPFLSTDCSGHTVWLVPPAQHMHAYLQHYRACKSKAPHNTAAAVMVPRRPAATWQPLLQGMRLVQSYPAGPAFRRSVPEPMEVWYDAAAARPALCLNAPANSKHRALFEASVAGMKVTVLLDSGASTCFATRSLVESLGSRLLQPTATRSVEVANGESALVHGATVLPLRLQRIRTDVRALVLDSLVPGVDLILGEDWLTAHNADLLYSHGTVHVTAHGRVHKLAMRSTELTGAAVLQHATSMLAAATTTPGGMRAKHLRRALKQGCEPFWVLIRACPTVSCLRRSCTLGSTGSDACAACPAASSAGQIQTHH